MRFVAILVVIVSVVSSPVQADTTLQCLETFYDKTGNNPYEVPQFFKNTSCTWIFVFAILITWMI